MWVFLFLGVIMSAICAVSLWKILNSDKIPDIVFVFSVLLPGIIGGVSLLIWWTLLVMELIKSL